MMSPLKLVRPTIAPEVMVDAVSANANWKREREERDLRVEETAVVVGRAGPVQEEVLMADEAVAATELEREADGPVQEAAQARVEHALEKDVDALLRSRDPGFEGHEARLHEEHQERSDQHPHR